MKVLVVHSAYQVRGGEDVVVESETALLAEHGHEVLRLDYSNSSIRSLATRVGAALGVVFSLSAYFKVIRTIREYRPDIVHVHNFFPLPSPSVFYACSMERVPVVMTLHNFRIICPSGTLLVDGESNLRSVQHGPWWTVAKGAYRGSVVGTAFVAVMIWIHRKVGTWRRSVTSYIVPSDFAKDIFVDAGLPIERLVVKANFVHDQAVAKGPALGFLYVGRLSKEKGVAILAAAATQTGLNVRAAGAGDLDVSEMQGLSMLGPLSRERVCEEMAQALAVVVPSICFEMFGLAVVEAYAQGTPVIASRIGALESLVEHGVTGLLVDAGDEQALASAMKWAMDHPDQMRAMGRAARIRYEREFSPGENYLQLVSVYRRAMRTMEMESVDVA